MSTSIINNYEPKWMREERYMYCEPVACISTKAFWAKLLRFFL